METPKGESIPIQALADASIQRPSAHPITASESRITTAAASAMFRVASSGLIYPLIVCTCFFLRLWNLQAISASATHGGYS